MSDIVNESPEMKAVDEDGDTNLVLESDVEVNEMSDDDKEATFFSNEKLTATDDDLRLDEELMDDLEIVAPVTKTEPNIPLPDGEEESVNTGIPGYVKYGIPGFFVFLVGSILGAYLFFKPSDGLSDGPKAVVNPLVNTISSEPVVVEPDSEFVPAPSVEPADNVFTSNTPSSSKLKSGDVKLLENRINYLEEQVAILIASKNISDPLVESLERKMIFLQNNSSTKKDITNINQSIDKVRDNYNSLGKNVAKNSQFVNNYTEKLEHTPPFTLLSVDVWGGSYNAVLSFKGKESMSRLGDIKAGWRIDSFVSKSRLRVCKLGTEYCTDIYTKGA